MNKVEIVQEYERVATVKELKVAIALLPDDLPAMDAMGEPLCVRVVKETDCQDESVQEIYLEVQ